MDILAYRGKTVSAVICWSVWFSSICFLFQIENWKSKIHNRDFQCLIPQELKITNLQCVYLSANRFSMA